jgi:GTPase SAR1 family protein
METVPLNRAQVNIVGPGRAGKSSLTRAIFAMDFVETESTVGIVESPTSLVMGVSDAGSWQVETKPEKELEDSLERLAIRISRGVVVPTPQPASSSSSAKIPSLLRSICSKSKPNGPGKAMRGGNRGGNVVLGGAVV